MSQRFGGRNTVVKLGVIEEYIGAYQTILSKQGLRTSYVDAFAGTGSVVVAKADDPVLPGLMDAQQVIEGSARRALSLERPFSRYLFIEKSPRKTARLRAELQADFSELVDRMKFITKDANVALAEFCGALTPEDRAVVFLDPFGNQVEWTTIEMLAQTRAVDLWYLFPSGLGVDRQISKDGSVFAGHVASLNKVLGTEDWPKAFLTEEARPNLFGEMDQTTTKSAGAAEITRFVIERMKPLFAGGVADEWLTLGSRNVSWYSLIFACANPKGGDIARRVACWIIKKAG